MSRTRLHVELSAGLQMCINGCVVGDFGRILVLTIGDMKMGLVYFFARPKSMTLTWLPRLLMPIKKLSGLISRWMNVLDVRPRMHVSR
jgi:hypothetical protein